MTKSYEDFEVCQKGIQLAKLFFKLVENKSFEKEFGFKNQIKRVRKFNFNLDISKFKLFKCV